MPLRADEFGANIIYFHNSAKKSRHNFQMKCAAKTQAEFQAKILLNNWPLKRLSGMDAIRAMIQRVFEFK